VNWSLNLSFTSLYSGADILFGVSILLQSGRAGTRNPVWAGDFITSKLVHIDPRAYPSSITVGVEFILSGK
jgi:hypothetical protein